MRGREPRRFGPDADVALVVRVATRRRLTAIRGGRPGRRASASHRSGKSGRVLAVVPDVLDRDARHAQAEDRARRGHPVVVVGAEEPAVQRTRADAQAVLGLGDVAAEAR